jgi:hypothetical protein
MKKISILYVFLFVISVYSVKAQTNPFLNAEINGPDTFGNYTVACYELPNVYGASYNWYNSGDLKINCGAGTIWHAGFVSRYNTNGGWIKSEVNGHEVWIWSNDVTYMTTTGPLFDYKCMIRCEVKYNGQTYWFAKQVFVEGY